jgi:4-hydroxy-tetrahydrodipicolinate reductase
MKILIHGAAGSMGQVLCHMVEPHELVAVETVKPKEGMIPELSNAPVCDVVVDFSHPSLLAGVIQYCQTNRVPLVLGTTNLEESHQKQLQALALHVPVIVSSNFSYGVSVMRRLVDAATKALDEFDIELTETHHIHKLDAPSGTAKTLLHDIKKASSQPRQEVYGRGPGSPAKEPGEIGVHSIRSGQNPGEHTVIFSSKEEQIEITHKAFGKQVFAKGALQAAKWLVTQEPGYYTMKEFTNE